MTEQDMKEMAVAAVVSRAHEIATGHEPSIDELKNPHGMVVNLAMSLVATDAMNERVSKTFRNMEKMIISICNLPPEELKDRIANLKVNLMDKEII